MEKTAIRGAYIEKRGDIKHIIKRVPFLSGEDEHRVVDLLRGEMQFFRELSQFIDLFLFSSRFDWASEWVASDQLPDYFTKPSNTKQQSKK